MDRKKKIKLYQILFLFIGITVAIFTFVKINEPNQKMIISKNTQKKLEKQLSNQDKNNNTNIFYNLKYAGLDLEGNRYTISSKEGTSSENNSSIINMKFVTANFYFKDNTTLIVSSDEGIYNNKTLDILFKGNVEAAYDNSKLYAEKAEFFSSKNYLSVSDKVRIVDDRGSMKADKLIFDIKKKTLNITSLENNQIKSKIYYK